MMRHLIDLVETAQREQPQPLIPVGDIASVNDDVNDILEPEEWDWDWYLGDIPLDDIVRINDFSDPERLHSIASLPYADRLPIIVSREDGYFGLLDGGHRMTVAKSEGRTYIRALVGVKNEPFTESAPNPCDDSV